MLIDSHCHLDSSCYKSNLDSIIDSAKSAGIDYLLSIAVSSQSSIDVLEISQQYNNVFATVGVHPLYIKDESISYTDLMLLAENKRAVGLEKQA